MFLTIMHYGCRMSDAIPTPHIQATGAHAQALIDDLNQLRDAGRLAIHMWENRNGSSFKKLEFPEFSWQYSTHNPAKKLDDLVRNLDPASNQAPDGLTAMSMSLLPPTTAENPVSIIPYEAAGNRYVYGGYLVSLEQSGSAPPARVLGGALEDCYSATNPFAKATNCGVGNILKKIGPSGDLAQESVDLLQPILTDFSNSAGGEPLDCNEIIVASAKDHMKAIVIPAFEANNTPTLGLNAVLQGLQHIPEYSPAAGNLPKDGLPVVLYHVNGSKQGQFSYVGQGKKELLEKAVELLKAIENDPDERAKAFKVFTLPAALKSLLGYDYKGSQEDRYKAIGEIEKQVKDLEKIAPEASRTIT